MYGNSIILHGNLQSNQKPKGPSVCEQSREHWGRTNFQFSYSYPLIPPACKPDTKKRWQQMKTISTGMRLATLMAKT